jgi:hypothetical protein
VLRDNDSVVHSSSLRLLAAVTLVLAGAFCVVVAGPPVAGGRIREVLEVTLWFVSVAVLVVELWWRPAVRISTVGVWIVDPLRTVFVPWPLLEETLTVQGLQLLTADRRFGSWAASRPFSAGNAWSTGRGIRGDNPMGFPSGMGSGAGPTLNAVLSGGDSPAGSRAGLSHAKLLVDQGWQAWQGSRKEEKADLGEVTTLWHWGSIVAVMLTAGAAILMGRLG